ncbi:MAG: outer membrane beta-barrel protein [Idiomarina sp.]|nr:outer membrane beta-barrel protein [Idiomarina sp.]
MKSAYYIIPATIATGLLLAMQPAQAQTLQNEWLFSAHTSYTSIDATTRRTVNDAGLWWGEHDDSNMNYGLSVTYIPWRNLGVRATYERGSDYRTVNQCPDNGVCPAILITESGSMEHFALVFAPEFEVYRNTVAFVTVGAARTEVSAGPLLPSYSETDLIYGLGISYQLSQAFFVSAEYQTTSSDYETVRLSAGIRF